MNAKVSLVLLLACSLVPFGLSAQQQPRDQGVFVEYTDEFMEQMKAAAAAREEKEKEKKLRLKMDVTDRDLPSSTTEFRASWYHPPLSQGITGSCWCFSGTSFFESEIYRLTKRKIKLSEAYGVYWEYVEKARRFVRERGDSVFRKGSQPNSLKAIWKKYGIVPHESYEGRHADEEFYDTRKLYEEMKNYLDSVKQSNEWNEATVLATITSILNHHMGQPPTTITVGGTSITPRQYLDQVLQLNLDDYIDVMSLREKPYYEKVAYEVTDNWWHSKDYYNVPLDDFMNIIKNAVRTGYTICIVGDTSESGYRPEFDVAMVPTYDIPADYIDEHARQFRFSNEATTDDHAIHLVGYLEKDGKDWYLIKDSGSSAYNGKNKGYFFYHEDYVKLKMMNYFIHKEAVVLTLGRPIE